MLPWLIAVVVLGASVAAMSNARGLGEAFRQTDWVPLAPALFLTAFSYACISAGLVSLGRAVGVSAPRWPMMRIAFVSVAVNQLVSFGGLAGYSIRAIMSKRYGVATGDAFAMSLVHSYLNNLAMFLLLAVGLVYLVQDSATDESWRATLRLGAGVVAVFFSLSTAAMFNRMLRRSLLRGVARVVLAVSPQNWGRALVGSLEEMDIALSRTARSLRLDPAAAVWPAVFLALDWLAALGVLWLCMDAVGEPVGLGVLVGAFSVGVVAGFASMLPGGLGAQDGSLAAVMVLQGVPLESAAIGTLLFRVVYYVAPFVATLPLYAWILRSGTEETPPR